MTDSPEQMAGSPEQGIKTATEKLESLLDINDLDEVQAGIREAIAMLQLQLEELAAGGRTQRKLSPEDAKKTLDSLRTRFTDNVHLHKDLEWSRVETALEANPEALWSVHEMEVAGHAPDVYDFDESGFDIGTCSQETPESARNCVYDKEAAAWLKEKHPDERFNGNAVEMAEAMGIDLMTPKQCRDVLQEKGGFDKRTWSWLKTNLDTRKTGYALNGSRPGDLVRVNRGNASFHSGVRAWRGSLRVSWA